MSQVALQTRDAGYVAPSFDYAALTLDFSGVIRNCNPDSETLFGYATEDLIETHISKLVPQLPGMPLIQNGRVNSQLEYFCHCGFPVEFQDREGNSFLGTLYFASLDDSADGTIRLIVRPFRI